MDCDVDCDVVRIVSGREGAPLPPARAAEERFKLLPLEPLEGYTEARAAPSSLLALLLDSACPPSRFLLPRRSIACTGPPLVLALRNRLCPKPAEWEQTDHPFYTRSYSVLPALVASFVLFALCLFLRRGLREGRQGHKEMKSLSSSAAKSEQPQVSALSRCLGLF